MGFSQFFQSVIGLFPVLYQPFIHVVCLFFIAFCIMNILMVLVHILRELKELVWPV